MSLIFKIFLFLSIIAAIHILQWCLRKLLNFKAYNLCHDSHQHFFGCIWCEYVISWYYESLGSFAMVKKSPGVNPYKHEKNVWIVFHLSLAQAPLPISILFCKYLACVTLLSSSCDNRGLLIFQ